MRLILAGLAAAALMIPVDAFAQREREREGQRGERERGERGERGQRGQGGRGGFSFGGGGGSLVMRALDKNNDGELSTEEINGAVAALKALDKNKDGKIDREEQRPDFVADMFERMDRDKDGKLTKAEAGERMGQILGDKASIDLKGFRAVMEERMQRFRGGRGGDRGRGGRPGEGGRPGGRPGGGDRDSGRPARPDNSDIEL